MRLYKKIIIFVCLTISSMNGERPIIFHSDGGQLGDHLASLYNAYVYAKKYNLRLFRTPFGGDHLFKSYNVLELVPHDLAGRCRVVYVTNEQDIVIHQHEPNVAFCVNVLTARLTPDVVTAHEAKALLQFNKSLQLRNITRMTHGSTVAVHVRKGNGGMSYDGELSSQQVFDFDPKRVKYTYSKSIDPFLCYKAMNRRALDSWWPLKFPPEQFYIDQIKKVISSKKQPLIIKLFTDDKDPQALVARFKREINDPSVAIEYHDNREKDAEFRTIEDLSLMSQCDILIRAKSGFSIVAEVMGNFKTVIFPLRYAWKGNKLIMTKVMIQGELL